MRFAYFIISICITLCLMKPAIAKNDKKTSKEKAAVHLSNKKTTSKKKSKRVVKRQQATKKRHKQASRSSKRMHIHSVSSGKLVYGAAELSERIHHVIKTSLGKADMGVYVKSMLHGDRLYAYHINRPLVPASTLKILTAEAALLFLKPNYRFATQLFTDGSEIKNGVLQGNLYIVLSGDPSLTYHDLTDLMLNLKIQQIQGISGNVYIDNTAYDQRFYGPDWEQDDKNYCYAAPISASIINHNCLPFKLTPSKVPGRAVHIDTSSKFFYPKIKNRVVTKPRHFRSCLLHLSDELGSGLKIEGCLSRGREPVGVSYVVTDIPEYNRALFKSVLNQLSIKVYGHIIFGPVSENASLIAYHVSEALPELINIMLKKSDNVIAGALFKKVGQLYTRRQGSWENGSYAVSRILAKKTGLNTSGMRILDGSGLSSSNLATPAQLMQILEFAYHHAPTSDAFLSALPIAGVDGTLKHRMGHIARKVKAKTGTISGVAGLAGYVTTVGKEETLAFVVLINGHKGMTWKYRDMEDNIVTALSRFKR